MTFKHENVLLLLFFAPIILLIFHYSYLRRERLIKKIFSIDNFKKVGVFRSRGKLFLKSIFLACCYSLMVISLAGPRYGFKDINLSTIGNNIFIAVDTSLSMKAQDVKPDRMSVAKRKILDFINDANGERIALIPFAGQPYMLIPLTSDYSIFKSFIDIVNTDLIPIQGTDFYNLIERMVKVISRYKLSNVSLLILSDGEDFGGNIDAAIKLCKKYHITIYAVGIGSGEYAPIPLKNGGFKKDKNGHLVTTRLNEKFLEKLALSTGGIYVKSTPTSEDIDFIYKKIAERNRINKTTIYKKRIYFNRFQWFLLPAFILLCLFFIINERKLKYLSIIFLILFTFSSGKLYANPYFNNEKGLKFYNQKNFRDAIKYFKKAYKEDKNLKFKFNLGDSLYKLKKFDNSSNIFNSIAKKTEDLQLKEKSLYNEGVINYKNKKYKKALENFKLAIKLNPEDRDARVNYELTLKKLNQKKNKNNQSKNNNNKKKNKNKHKNKKQKQKQKQRQNQNQNKNKNNKKNKKEHKEKKPNREKQSKIDKKLLNLYSDNKKLLKQAIKKHFLLKNFKKPEKDW